MCTILASIRDQITYFAYWCMIPFGLLVQLSLYYFRSSFLGFFFVISFRFGCEFHSEYSNFLGVPLNVNFR